MSKCIIWILKALACLPWCMLYAISDFAYLILRHVVHYRQKVVRENLRNSFPEKSELELVAIEKKFYHHLCDLFVESIKLLHITDEEMKSRVDFRNTELVDRLAADKRSFVLFMGHTGNWEWVQSLPLFLNGDLLLATLYKPAKSELANEVIGAVRSRFGNDLIQSQSALRKLIGYNMRGRQFMVAFIADQRTASRQHAMMFMSQKSTYYTGGEDLAKHIKAHMLYLDVEKPSRGHYIFTFKELDPVLDSSKPYPYTHAFMTLLEQNIRRQPEIWTWSHNRWKNNHKIEVPIE